MTYKWWKSKHCLTYLRIAIRHHISPRTVHLIAHGIDQLDEEGDITKDLIKHHILRRIHSNPQDDEKQCHNDGKHPRTEYISK